MTATTNTDVFISLMYLVAWIRRPFAAALQVTKQERKPQ
jgi:hypothetical protein